MAEPTPPAILYVDDDDTNRRALSVLLRHAGFATTEATTGREALRLAAAKPDLIILDVRLPDIDGFEVCRRIKAHPATSAIPVLHMSGVFVSTEDKAQALEGGADAYLTKPVEPQELVATVKALLRMHQAEEAARAAAQQWQVTFDAIHDALCLLDEQGRLQRCNRALAALLGRPAAELLGRPYLELVAEVFGPAGRALADLLQGPPGQARELHLGERWYRVTADPVPGAAPGGMAGRVHLLADVTERRVLEEQLRQAQKMEAVGRLAGGIAHDFNNLLTAILGNLALLEQQMPADDPRAELMRTTEQAAWRAADLTRQLLGFSRQTRLQARALDLNVCVQETVALLARTLGPAVEIEVRALTPSLWPVWADPGQMGQILLNLALNARDAMPAGGKLTIETDNVALDEEQARLAGAPVSGLAGEHVRLRIRDTGQGIPAEVQPRIFEPFFTTKEVGHGTGLGLAVVFGIVQQHGGWITCQSELGAGATFAIHLPRYREQESGVRGQESGVKEEDSGTGSATATPTDKQDPPLPPTPDP
jgi:PAS domain S-box-containing protein